ncbi:carbohydrate binding family 9 domain-containing protein, partial [Candidatus Fermentibacteria bacterium]|nr:carbohydrate binding family 9 domain-containing protein [Candidatus Fermentibacteria bacterium]
MLPILFLLLTAVTAQAEHAWDIPRVDRGPVLDGRLDEECWSACTPREGFTQRDPSPGAPSSEQTILRAVYTEDALYVAFECHDSQAGRMVSRLRRRDASVWKDDNVDLWIDPTGSGMELYYFSTNPRGVKYDALNGPRGQNSNQRWDAHWDVATAVTEWGWCAEFEVPFSNLKFDFDPSKPWLFNAGRVIRRSGEETYATSVPYEHNMFYAEDALHLCGIRDIAREVGLKVSPYSKGDYRRFPRASASDDLQKGIGMDVDLDIGR